MVNSWQVNLMCTARGKFVVVLFLLFNEMRCCHELFRIEQVLCQLQNIMTSVSQITCVLF